VFGRGLILRPEKIITEMISEVTGFNPLVGNG